MKWVFLLFLMLGVPVTVGWISQNRSQLPKLAFVVGALPFFLDSLHLQVAPISWNLWQGTVRGIDISLIDALAIAIIMTTPRASSPKLLKVGIAVIFVAMAISTALAEIWMPSFFYIWQFIRMMLIATAMMRLVAASPNAVVYALMGMGVGMFSEVILAGKDFAGGAIQAGGSFGHQNTLGLASHFAAYPAAALLLAGRHVKLAAFILACEVFIAFVGGSRATVGLFGVGMGVVTLLSIKYHRTSRKASIAGGLAVLALVAIPIMITAVNRRSDAAKESSNKERQAFEHAAEMIIADYPLGVGANRYVIVANLGGYSSRAGVSWQADQRRAPVHNSYYLITAEMGYIGLLGYLIMIFAILRAGLGIVRSKIKNIEGELSVGLTTAVLVASIHAYFEWTAMTYPIHYLYAIDAGMLLGLAYRFMVAKRSALRSRFPMAAPSVAPIAA